MGRLDGKVAIISGGARGQGEAEVRRFVEEGAQVVFGDVRDELGEAVAKDIGDGAVYRHLDVRSEDDWQSLVKDTEAQFGKIDVLVNNAAHQMSFEDIEEISDEEWDYTFRTNIFSMFYLSKAAAPHMRPGAAIINTASVNADTPSPQLLAYATTKGAIQNFTGGLAQLLADKGIRVNCVAPGPIWTPLIPSTMPPEKVENFGKNYPIGRPGQPKELAPVYVMLASDEASYVSGATVAVTGGKPIL
jgi:NAD(P)-dependent dehydrogenase (short-subunit alcohol dehydrogenase family)